MTKYLKYVISLFLAFAVIVGDGILNTQSNSVEYYQSSNVIISRELDFKSFLLYKFSFSKSIGKSSLPIFIFYKNVKDVLTLQIKVLFTLCEILHQKINSFIKQLAFVNETITSGNFNSSLYIA